MGSAKNTDMGDAMFSLLSYLLCFQQFEKLI
jgi:hypothetical protein